MNPDWTRDYSSLETRHLVAMTEPELASVDPLATNLIVAKDIPSLADLDVAHYQAILNSWTDDFRNRCLPYWEQFFHETPEDFENDIRYFRLGMVCQYLDLEVGISYHPEQRDATSILYTDPSDLFLNGVIDTKFGTCGNMAALHVAIGWRMGWPVSLACVNSHFVCRYDDGKVAYNVESTDTGRGGWSCRTDGQYRADIDIPEQAIRSGSDLRALSARELLGAFVGLRARHTQDVGKHNRDASQMLQSESDWLLSRYLFPNQRITYKNQLAISAMRGETLFKQTEIGHPVSFAAFLQQMYSRPRPVYDSQPVDRDHSDLLFSTISKESKW
ncbi:MAG: hypothetical protein RIK87_28600 [Fuerstiella sp.]